MKKSIFLHFFLFFRFLFSQMMIYYHNGDILPNKKSGKESEKKNETEVRKPRPHQSCKAGMD